MELLIEKMITRVITAESRPMKIIEKSSVLVLSSTCLSEMSSFLSYKPCFTGFQENLESCQNAFTQMRT